MSKAVGVDGDSRSIDSDDPSSDEYEDRILRPLTNSMLQQIEAKKNMTNTTCPENHSAKSTPKDHEQPVSSRGNVAAGYTATVMKKCSESEITHHSATLLGANVDEKAKPVIDCPNVDDVLLESAAADDVVPVSGNKVLAISDDDMPALEPLQSRYTI